MGDPKRRPNRYSGPRHPWEAERIKDEKKLVFEYGLKTKKEIWKLTSKVQHIKSRVKGLSSSNDSKADAEVLLQKLRTLNLITEGQTLDDALELTAQNLMERRLQTQVVRQGLARSMKQSRQMITHGHVRVNGKKLTSPSYIVTAEEQFLLAFQPSSPFISEEHPERKVPEVEVAAEKEAIKADVTPETIEEALEKEVSAKLDGEAAAEGVPATEAPATEEAEKPAEAKVTEVKNE
jgi:small subunit ribosomal protein S4